MFNKKTITDIDPRGKRVLVRVDFNVPIENGVVQDDTRITAALPTIQYLLDHGAAVLLCSHLGRPKDKPDPKYSLKPVADYLAGLVKATVKFSEECVGPKATAAAKELKQGEILLLENTRFYPGETKNDPEMSKALADLADLYVNDAFGSAHRAHASTEGVAKYLPAVAGFLMEKEIRYLGQALAEPKRPFVAILGGAKVSDKIEVIRNLLSKADQLLIGGGMANTFFKAQGLELGDSLVEAEALDTAKALLAIAGKKKAPIPANSHPVWWLNIASTSSSAIRSAVPCSTKATWMCIARCRRLLPSVCAQCCALAKRWSRTKPAARPRWFLANCAPPWKVCRSTLPRRW